MAITLSPNAFYQIRDPQKFYSAMRDDINRLRSHKKYLSLTTIIVCCLDALAAGSGEAKKSKFDAYVTKYLPDLEKCLRRLSPGKSGGITLYEQFRNGFAHLRAPMKAFAIAEDHELGGQWAAEVDINGKTFVALNVDRLTLEFLSLISQLEASATANPTT
jgi:hypothetical protein